MDRKMQFTGKEMQVVTKQKKMLNFPPNYASQSCKERALFACQAKILRFDDIQGHQGCGYHLSTLFEGAYIPAVISAGVWGGESPRRPLGRDHTPLISWPRLTAQGLFHESLAMNAG